MIKRGKAEKWAARGARLAASLRENLRRRKAQARGRAGQNPPSDDMAPQDADIEARAPDFRRNPGRE
jgi:hypothetical protein